MKYLNVIFVFILFVSCSDNNINSTENVNDSVLKVEFLNDSLIYDLKGYQIPIEFQLTNISENNALLQATSIRSDEVWISQKVQHLRDGEWVTDYEISADTNILIAPQSSVGGKYWAHLKGKWRTLIPIENYDTLYTNEVNVINEIESKVDFRIYQIADSQKVHVIIKNNSAQEFRLGYFKYGYCHFSYLSYDLIENKQYKELFWDDIQDEWKLTRTFVNATCFSDGPETIIQPGEEYQETLEVILPKGMINVRFRFYFGDDLLDYESISKTFEYD